MVTKYKCLKTNKKTDPLKIIPLLFKNRLATHMLDLKSTKSIINRNNKTNKRPNTILWNKNNTRSTVGARKNMILKSVLKVYEISSNLPKILSNQINTFLFQLSPIFVTPLKMTSFQDFQMNQTTTCQTIKDNHPYIQPYQIKKEKTKKWLNDTNE